MGPLDSVDVCGFELFLIAGRRSYDATGSRCCESCEKIKTILTAHNLEDQVETFFIRLSRGSGLQGLSSMKSINKINNNIKLFLKN